MEIIISIGLLLTAVVIIFLLIRLLLEKIASLKEHQLTQREYQEISEKWKKKQTENLEEAMKVCPSRHLLSKDEEWIKMVEKQREYAERLNDLCDKQLQKEYGLTKKEWKELESRLVEEFLSKK